MNDDKWVVEDKIIRLMASVDNEDNVWGHDTNLGQANTMRAYIKQELDQIRLEAILKAQIELLKYVVQSSVSKKELQKDLVRLEKSRRSGRNNE